MRNVPKPNTGPEPDLIDRIADALPVEIRAEYYRELRHCRSLPENDEMLRILRVMQFLTLLMYQVPNRVMTEREQLQELFASAIQSFDHALRNSQAYQKQINEQFAALPITIVREVNAEKIASRINQKLDQEFDRSTLPQIASDLAKLAAQMKIAVQEFSKTASLIGDAYQGSASEARKATKDMAEAITHSVGVAREAAGELSSVCEEAFRWSLYVLTGVGIVVGFFLGLLFSSMHWF
jgi:ElaB/YqjD/DUF883 family membrane-anchored ribosome-binding protein